MVRHGDNEKLWNKARHAVSNITVRQVPSGRGRL